MLSQESALNQRFFIKKPHSISFFNLPSPGLACFSDWFSLEMPDVSTVSVQQPDWFFSAQGPLAGRFKVRPCFYPRSQGDPADVSLSVLENRQNLGRTVRPVRTIQCSHCASVPRAALRSALGYLLLPLWGRRIGSRPEARGGRPEGTAKQPENFGAILRRYPRITMHVASRKTRGLSPGIS